MIITTTLCDCCGHKFQGLTPADNPWSFRAVLSHPRIPTETFTKEHVCADCQDFIATAIRSTIESLQALNGPAEGTPAQDQSQMGLVCNSRTPSLDVAISIGAKAFRRGAKLEDCPYTDRMILCGWTHGWHVAASKGYPTLAMVRTKGRLSFHSNEAIDACPFEKHSSGWVLWREGWLEEEHFALAQAEAKREAGQPEA